MKNTLPIFNKTFFMKYLASSSLAFITKGSFFELLSRKIDFVWCPISISYYSYKSRRIVEALKEREEKIVEHFHKSVPKLSKLECLPSQYLNFVGNSFLSN